MNLLYILTINEKPYATYNDLTCAIIAYSTNITHDIKLKLDIDQHMDTSIFDKICDRYCLISIFENTNLINDYYRLYFENDKFIIKADYGEIDSYIDRFKRLSDLYFEINDSKSLNCFIPVNESIMASSEKFNTDYIKEKVHDNGFDIESVVDELNNNLIKYIKKDNLTLEQKKEILKADQEKWNEFKRKFVCNKNTYRKVKEDLENNKIDKIPEMFKEYNYFQYLEEKNILDTADELSEYINILPLDTKNNLNFIPKSETCDNLFE